MTDLLTRMRSAATLGAAIDALDEGAAEIERLRALLREAKQQIPITHARHEILRDRIDAALAGERT